MIECIDIDLSGRTWIRLGSLALCSVPFPLYPVLGSGAREVKKLSSGIP